MQTPNQSVADFHHQSQSLDEIRMALGDAFGKEQMPDAPCVVEQVHKKDDADHMPNWKRYLHALTPVLSFLALASYWTYFGFRIKYTLLAQAASGKTFIMAWIFIGVECGVALPMFLHRFWQCFLIKGRKREKLRIIGDVAPTVDVFITTCGEDVDVVIDTLRAAATVDYPPSQFRVIILDDAGSAELYKAVKDVAELYPNVYYHARTKIKGAPHHFKAGNLNGGLALVDSLEEGGGEYIAALDADMIPEPDWLRAIVAHMVVDDKLALSCPPQLFYNVPRNDPLLQSLNSFVHISEPVKDAAGVAWCTGSGYAIRRAALDSIGGFPTGSLAEDVHCSSMLLGAGWKTAYIHEPLQFGTVPEDFQGHIKQRTRWTIGTMQTSIILQFCICGKIIKHMSFFQRLSGFVYTVSSLFTIFLAASLLTMPIVLISGGRLVAFVNNDQLRWLIRLCFFALILNRINEWVMYLPAGYRLGQRDAGAMMWMAPYHAITIIRSFLLPSWLGGKMAVFKPSGGLARALEERDPRRRANLWQRIKVIIFGTGVWMHCVYILFCAAAVGKSTVEGVLQNWGDYKQILLYMLVHACWPPVLWLVALNACFAPIFYTIWPPNMPDREDLLDRDPLTGVAHPTEGAKKLKWDKTNALHEIQYSALTAYAIVVFVGSFLY